MNTKTFLGVLMLIGLLIFIVGCAVPEDTAPQDNGPAANEPQQEQVEPEPAKTELSQELTDLLAKSAKYSSYEYVYQSTENAKYTAKHYVNGDKLRIKYDRIQKYDNFYYFDIYLDKAKGLAFLICDDVEDCKGTKGREVMFDEFNMETPKEVVSHIDNGEKVDETEWDSKKTIVVSYTNKDSNDEKIWLDKFSGLPVKREIWKGDTKTTITYNQLVTNPVQPTSVDLPTGLEMA
jgi:hypothetical protein